MRRTTFESTYVVAKHILVCERRGSVGASRIHGRRWCDIKPSAARKRSREKSLKPCETAGSRSGISVKSKPRRRAALQERWLWQAGARFEGAASVVCALGAARLGWKDTAAGGCSNREQKIGCAAVKLELQIRKPRD